ncbi:alpha-galactosidase [Pedobacter sp. HMWF019]|uniref:carboxypeptidase regulatory-like domain-containing protein n=1 Tax=Pedobacter sp. HMWF019 TaxID=2056856 RepID=UPI000D343673|nr:carboxypeptidase regulatory-like domain-containing protein [Pedobacter sp. HMWF019]PTS98182.1 alpha-galactosidase [Pedobacter sp. HMWF019]
MRTRILLITFLSLSGSFYQKLLAQEKFIEAEAATLSNGARIEACSTCSGGNKVAGLGDLKNGTAVFSLQVPKTGLYPLKVYFRVSDDRSLGVRVNQESVPQKVVFRRTAPSEQSSLQQIFVPLKAGLNTVSFDNPVEGGPDLDRIAYGTVPVKSLSFKGIIKNKNGKPVKGVEVQLRGGADRLVSTDAAGNYLINDVPEGNYLLSAFANGQLIFPHSRTAGPKDNGAALNFTASAFVKKAADIQKLGKGNTYINYNLKTGTADFYTLGKQILSNVYAEAHIPKVISSMDYSKHEIKEEPFTDQLGSGTLFTVSSTAKRLPEMIQEYWLYTDKGFILSRLSVKNNETFSSAYMAPLKSETSFQVLPSGNNYALFVPFDNDKWVRYVAFPFSKVVSSHEVSVLFNETSNQGLVIGSVDHDNWKTGVVTATEGNTLRRLEAYGGFTYATSRDILPHGKISGKLVRSPRMFAGSYADWKEGMNDFAAVNSGLHKRLKWPGGVPFGWNSWGKIQFNLTGQKAVEVSDFFAKALRDKSFENDGVTYIGLDAGAEDRTDEELTAFVNECRKNNQIPGGYYGPFADWGGDSTRNIEGTPYTYKDLYLRANGNKQYIDGAAAIDPTHPGTKARIKKSLERFKRLGFKFMKVDFLAHASLEADHYYNPKVTTGIQAYNEGMKYLREVLGDSIYLNQAISPIFPADYAQSRRIACDVFGDTEKIEYAMNSLTYGWWLSNVYLYNDADHIVLEGHSEAENRSRVTSSVTTGIYISGDDLSAGGSMEAKTKSLKFLTNPDVNAIARSGQSFQPVYPAQGGKAANAFFRKDGQYLYLALFNYSNEEVHLRIPVIAIPNVLLNGHHYKELWTGQTGTAGTILEQTIPAADVRILRFELTKK